MSSLRRRSDSDDGLDVAVERRPAGELRRRARAGGRGARRIPGSAAGESSGAIAAGRRRRTRCGRRPRPGAARACAGRPGRRTARSATSAIASRGRRLERRRPGEQRVAVEDDDDRRRRRAELVLEERLRPGRLEVVEDEPAGPQRARRRAARTAARPAGRPPRRRRSHQRRRTANRPSAANGPAGRSTRARFGGGSTCRVACYRSAADRAAGPAERDRPLVASGRRLEPHEGPGAAVHDLLLATRRVRSGHGPHRADARDPRPLDVLGRGADGLSRFDDPPRRAGSCSPPCSSAGRWSSGSASSSSPTRARTRRTAASA